MKRFYLLFAFVFLLVGVDTFAQGMLNAEKRKMNMKILQTLERLEVLSAPSSDDQADALMEMFRDPSTLVFNDLMQQPYRDQVSVSEYVAALRKLNDVKVSFTDIVKSEPYVSAGSVCVKVQMKKSISYYDDRAVQYSSEQLYGAPIDITIVFSYDDFDGTCLIESLEGSAPSGQTLGADHLVIKRNHAVRDIRYKNENASKKGRYYNLDDCPVLAFGNNSTAFLPVSAASEDWYYMQGMPSEWDPDVFISQSVSDKGFLTLDTKEHLFRVQAHNSTTLMGAFQVEGDLDKKASISDEVGVELRFMPGIGNRLNLGIYGGLAVSYSYLDVAVEDLAYQYRIYSQDGYVRKYLFDHVGQRFSFVDGVLFGGAALECAVSRRWNLEAKLGGKAYYNLYTKAGDLYCDYQVLEADGSVSHKVGHFKAATVKNQKDLSLDVWPCPLSAVAALGANVHLNKRLQLSFGLEYEYGLNYYSSSSLQSYRGYKYPVTYSSKEKMDVAQWMFTDSFNLKRRALWLNLGVIYKFSFKK
jgi:hypothetical protein